MRRRRFIATGAGAALAGLLPRSAKAQGAAMVTDSAGRTVALPARVARVFAAGPPASLLLYALAPDRMVGWNQAPSDAEREFLPAKYAGLPGLGRLTGRGNTANVEVVLRAKPDLILDYGSVRPTFASLADRVQQQTGIAYVLIDGAFSEMPAAFRMLGAMLDERARAEELAGIAADTLAAIDRRVAAVPKGKRPRVYYGRGPRGLDTGMEGSINVESIERVGALNVAASLGKGGMTQVSMEQILLWNPEVIVTIDANFFALALKDPVWAGIAAVKSRRVHLAPTLPFGWIDFPPSVNRLIGLRWLAKLFYPAEFPEPLRPQVRDFYARFYHRAPTDAQFDLLLQGTALRHAAVPP